MNVVATQPRSASHLDSIHGLLVLVAAFLVSALLAGAVASSSSIDTATLAPEGEPTPWAAM